MTYEEDEYVCEYCFLPIDTDTYGWGWLVDDYGYVRFHEECLQIYEGIVV